MKLLFLIEEINRGGKERRLTELIKGLMELSDEIQIHLALSKRNIAYEELLNLPIKIHYLEGISGYRLAKQYLALFKAIQPNIIHTWSFKTSFFAALLKPYSNYKLITGFIGDTFGFSLTNNLLAKILIYRRSELIIANSETGLKSYKVPEKKGKVIYNGFSFNRIVNSRTDYLKQMNVQTPNVILMLANVTPYKDYQLFLTTANNIIRHRNDVTFVSVGKILPEFEQLTAPYINNKHHRIKFLGFRSDVGEIITECNIGVLCTYTEGISNAIIELMANEIPVVTNDIKGGSKEVITNGEDGIICPNEMLEKSLIYLLDNSTARIEMGTKAQKKIQDNFTLTSMVNAYYEVYLKINEQG